MRLKLLFAGLALLALSALCVPRFAPQDLAVPLPEARLDLLATARQVIATHPDFTELGQGSASYLAFVRTLQGDLREPLPWWRVYEDEDLVLNYVHDPHTNLQNNFSPFSSPDILPLGFDWARGGLVAYRVAGSPRAVRTGDRVLQIGGLPVAGLLPRLRRFLSGNGPWLRTLAGLTLPFGDTLRWLGLVRKGRVEMRLSSPSGQTYIISEDLVPTDLASARAYLLGEQNFMARYIAPPRSVLTHAGPFYAWGLTPDYALFTLASCDDTPGYERAVTAFFRAAQAADAAYVVIDLQQNMGGDEAVAQPMLRYLPLRPAYTNRQGPVNPRQIYRGKVYVLIDGGSMSSAVDIAELLSEAGYATLVGSPAGMASQAPGNVQSYRTPDGRMAYIVSTEFVPSVNGQVTPALAPAISLPLTARDIARGRNPVAAWLGKLAAPRVKT